MNETEQLTHVQQTEMAPRERAAIIRHLCREIDYFNEFVMPPTQETQDYVGKYVDLRATDPEAAAKEFPAIEQMLEQARKFKQKRTLGDLGRQGMQSGFGQ